MNGPVRFPGNASVYELIRTRPGVRERLNAVGVTSDYIVFRIGDAARAVGVPVERIVEIVERAPATSR